MSLLGLALLAPVHAIQNEVAEGPLASVLDDQPQVPGSCAPEAPAVPVSYPQIHYSPISDDIVSRCQITAVRLHQAMSARPPLLVDIRHAREYDRAHIAGALNITAGLLPYKAFARNRSVVLVDAGHSEQQLLRACEQLISKGFARVQALNGGMAAWASAGYATTGVVGTSTALLSLSSREVTTALSERSWVLVLDPADVASLPEDLAALPRVDLSGDVDALVRDISAHDDTKSPMPGILFLSSANNVELMALDIAGRLQNRPVRVATDGVAGIQTYRTQRTAMLARPAGGVLGHKRCGG